MVAVGKADFVGRSRCQHPCWREERYMYHRSMYSELLIPMGNGLIILVGKEDFASYGGIVHHKSDYDKRPTVSRGR